MDRRGRIKQKQDIRRDAMAQKRKMMARIFFYSLRLCDFVSFLFILSLFYPIHAVFADPWGKDASLAQIKLESCQKYEKKCETPLLGSFAEIMIKFHQQVISPADGPRSHYKPSSSQYALDAMRKYGFFIGLTMGCDRLMRENKEEWVYRWTVDGAGKPIKYDPVH
jgi:putative component of membrane protein insertase Oxa1/YidC/SpoIIIJ protein YidD